MPAEVTVTISKDTRVVVKSVQGFTDEHGNGGAEAWEMPFGTLVEQLGPALVDRDLLGEDEFLYPAMAQGFADPERKADPRATVLRNLQQQGVVNVIICKKPRSRVSFPCPRLSFSLTPSPAPPSLSPHLPSHSPMQGLGSGVRGQGQRLGIGVNRCLVGIIIYHHCCVSIYVSITLTSTDR